LYSAVPAKSQDIVVLHAKQRWDSTYDMNLYTAFYIDSTNKRDISTVTKQTFTPDSNFRRNLQIQYGNQFVTVWIRWRIHNPLSGPQKVLLLYHRMSFLSLYVEENSKTRFINNSYHFFTSQTKNQRRGFEFVVSPGSTVTAYARMYNPYRNFAMGYPVIISSGEYKPVIQKLFFDQRYFVFVDVLFLSIILFISIHTLAQYFFNNKRQEFLLYAFYTICVFIYFLFKFEENQYIDLFFSHFPTIHKYGNNAFSYIMFFAYYRFVRSFINFKEVALWFYRLILVTEKILLTAIVADIILVLSNLALIKVLIFNVLRSYLVLFAFVGIYLLFRSKKALSLFIAVGSGCLVVGGLISMVLSWITEGPYTGRFDPIVYMQFGMVLELICFTLGLSYKTSLIEKEKIYTQQQLIGQLKENRKLQDELTNKLEFRVQEQTSRILAQQQQIEKEKEQQLTLGFQKKLTEMELKLLKSQLNPHFYFNTLNNLYGLSMIAPKKAPQAILKLSDIMEYVIYDCKSEKVPLIKELKFISSYIDLERLRYDEQAAIGLKIEGDCNGYVISPLLLIQFIENAFKHGMEENKPRSFLSINIHIEEGWLHYNSINSIKNNQHFNGGLGLENVKKRLDILYTDQHELKIQEGIDTYEVNLKLLLK
jgi:hypothetical protein